MIKSTTTQNVAGGTILGAGGPAGIMLFVRQTWPEFNWWPVEADAAIIAVLTTVLIPMISRAIAFSREPEKARKSINNQFRILPFILAPAMAAATLSGCQGMTPALAGKTNYSVEFQDTTADQNTVYKMQIKAPAGVELDSITGMTYDWNPDGSGGINVSQQGGMDTTQQAAAAVEVGRQQLEAINMVLNALAPVIGQKLQSDDNQASIEAGVSAKEMEAAIALIEEWNRQQAGR